MPFRTLLASFICGLAVATAQAQTSPQHSHSGAHDHRFSDADRWSQMFDDPARDAWQRPHEVIQALALAPDAVVADVGAGTGYFTVRLAHMLSEGRVIAVDVEPDMVRYVRERAQREGLKNVTAQLGGPEGPRLKEPVDLVFFVDVYHHIGARGEYFARVRESLKPDGRLAIIDFRLDSPRGPSRAGKVPPDEVKRELAQAGFELAEEHGFLPDQYFLVFRPAKR